MRKKVKKSIPIEAEFFEEQLYKAQQSLFFARSVKEARFLTNRINFLKEQLKESGVKSMMKKFFIWRISLLLKIFLGMHIILV